MSITVYGASDDLIEIEGALREEFSAGEDDARVLAFSDGTVLRVRYDLDGFWRIARLHAGTASYEKREATDEDDDYSDRVTLGIERGWVVCGDQFETIGGSS